MYFIHKPVIYDNKNKDDLKNKSVWRKSYFLLKNYYQGKFPADPLLNTLGGKQQKCIRSPGTFNKRLRAGKMKLMLGKKGLCYSTEIKACK